MSRCFPYPPPGYAGKVASTDAALIESIKLKSERRESKESRTGSNKDKSKYNKVKSEDKKHGSKERKEKSSRSHGSSDQKRKESKDLLKGTEVETEQLEKSGLTEEHGQPAWPQSPGYLSDVSQINHKRKRDVSSQPNQGCKPEKINRIELASSPRQHESSSAGSEQTCSTSGRDNSLHQKPCLTIANTAVTVKDSISKHKIKDPTLHAVKDIGSTHQQNGVCVPARTRHPAESAYESLAVKWVPPPIQWELPMDDQEWLYGARKQNEHTATTNTAFNAVPSCGSSSLWPRGQYLPDADVYSLPYTIPL